MRAGLTSDRQDARLHLLRGRLLAGWRHKAAKGELRVVLPVGFDYESRGPARRQRRNESLRRFALSVPRAQTSSSPEYERHGAGQFPGRRRTGLADTAYRWGSVAQWQAVAASAGTAWNVANALSWGKASL